MSRDTAHEIWAQMADFADDGLERGACNGYSQRLLGSASCPSDECGSSHSGYCLLRCLLHKVGLSVWSLAMSVKCWSLLLDGCGAKN